MARFVLVHGAFSGAWIWGPLTDHLKAAGHAVAAFDLPGLGDDKTPASEVTLDRCVARLCEVLAADSEPAIVVGNSMGGVIATQAAARCPERRGARLRNRLPAKERSESSRPDKASGGGRRSGAGQYHHRR